jgi:hypothetical protein
MQYIQHSHASKSVYLDDDAFRSLQGVVTLEQELDNGLPTAFGVPLLITLLAGGGVIHLGCQ